MVAQSPSPLSNCSRRLLLAIVRRAILDFVLYRDIAEDKNKKNHHAGADAAGWLFFDGGECVDTEGRYSFVYCCIQLDLDPQQVRASVLKMTRKDVKRFTPGLGDS